MAGSCGRAYRIDPRRDPAPCNALQDGPDGLLVPAVELQAQPGITVTPPAPGACPAVWEIGVDASWAQNGNLTFAHSLTGADRVWERVAEVPTLTIPRAGVWEVDYNARGAVSLPAATAGAEYVTAGVYKNGALIVGSESLVCGTAGAGTGGQATGGLSFLHPFNAGDTVELWAYRIGQAGTASVVSNPDGRCRLMLHWLAPVGDAP
ncbi:hypothetical protein [Streptomyces misionensis]|uniref:hypothetical protein n=1 Tax=Streptomyces misionensis TaxID=67331 RepID=UPI0033A468BD